MGLYGCCASEDCWRGNREQFFRTQKVEDSVRFILGLLDEVPWGRNFASEVQQVCLCSCVLSCVVSLSLSLSRHRPWVLCSLPPPCCIFNLSLPDQVLCYFLLLPWSALGSDTFDLQNLPHAFSHRPSWCAQPISFSVFLPCLRRQVSCKGSQALDCLLLHTHFYITAPNSSLF